MSTSQLPSIESNDESISSNYINLVDDAVKWVLNKPLPPQEKVLIILLLRNGLRVSEIVNAGKLRILDKWRIYVYSTKNKHWRVCQTAEGAEIIGQFGESLNLNNWQRNRFYYYRLLRGLLAGIETQREGNTAVTHAARNILAQQTYEITGSEQATMQAIGNKSIEATAHYVRRNQRRAFVKGGIKGKVSGTVSNLTANTKDVIRKRSK